MVLSTKKGDSVPISFNLSENYLLSPNGNQPKLSLRSPLMLCNTKRCIK